MKKKNYIQIKLKVAYNNVILYYIYLKHLNDRFVSWGLSKEC